MEQADRNARTGSRATIVNEQPLRLFILGATATGKSAVGAAVARALGGEVISLDSMQVYRDLPCLTAQPTAEERQLAPHHLIDFLDGAEQFDVFSYLEAVTAILDDLDRRQVPALFVGGTTYYFRALVDGFDDLPKGSPEERRSIVAQFGDDGPRLHGALRDLDPDSADRIHPNDKKKIIRALEICRLAGKPMSQLIGGPRRALVPNFLAFSLHMAREELYRRLDDRVDEMVASGALDEVRALAQRLGKRDCTVHQALGVRQLLPVVSGETSLEDAVMLLKRDTRRFAKRQLSFLRQESRIVQLDWTDFADKDSLVAFIVDRYGETIARSTLKDDEN